MAFKEGPFSWIIYNYKYKYLFVCRKLLRKNQHFYWNEKHQESFDSVEQALADATALAAPNEEGRFVLDTDASAIAIAGMIDQELEYNGKTALRPIVYGSKSLTRTQLNYGSPKRKVYAVFYFIRKLISYLAGQEFTLRVDNAWTEGSTST